LALKKKQIEESIAWLNDRLENTKSDSEELQKQLEQLRTSKELEVASYDREIIKRENKLLKLNRFIEQRTELLTKLELLDLPQDGLAENSPTERTGHDFSEVFGSDVSAAVAYIQVYLKEKGIYYSRNVLETFYALLMSNDLIILAGDSGSGKTNLVKSFADAIGGKSVIVPVKPNWTSSEDLIGYYNPLEKKYLSTQFLDAIIEASKHPEIPYLICLDEMNLARVEYYFADFLSLLEERESQPELRLYPEAESAHLVSECRMFLSLVDEATSNSESINSFVDILKNEELNEKLHKLCGFQDGSSLLKYHSQLRKNLGSYLSTPSSLVIPPNVRFIGAINVDETTHYLSPKILDRAHIIKFSSSLLSKWDDIEAEFEDTELDINLSVILSPGELNFRTSYPRFDREDKLVKSLLFIAEEYLEPLGIEFGLRSVRQAREFAKHAEKFEASYEQILNSLVLHKILPKMMFDGEKELDEDYAKKDLLSEFRDYLGSELDSLRNLKGIDYSVAELDRVIANAKANDWVVNYWSR
jgi:energy-coupling factor transporter ATP-binding protein EcfA2